jgi:hypothetical protein
MGIASNNPKIAFKEAKDMHAHHGTALIAKFASDKTGVAY